MFWPQEVLRKNRTVLRRAVGNVCSNKPPGDKKKGDQEKESCWKAWKSLLCPRCPLSPADSFQKHFVHLSARWQTGQLTGPLPGHWACFLGEHQLAFSFRLPLLCLKSALTEESRLFTTCCWVPRMCPVIMWDNALYSCSTFVWNLTFYDPSCPLNLSLYYSYIHTSGDWVYLALALRPQWGLYLTVGTNCTLAQMFDSSVWKSLTGCKPSPLIVECLVSWEFPVLCRPPLM